jgi:hypothetical protein
MLYEERKKSRKRSRKEGIALNLVLVSRRPEMKWKTSTVTHELIIGQLKSCGFLFKRNSTL